MALKELRVSRKLTQREAAQRLGISLRSYIMYENDESKRDSFKYKFILQELDKINRIDEETGILSQQDIKDCCAGVFSSYKVNYCYLFGSYAKGEAGEKSDVDLLISTEETGLRYYEMVERLRERLHKKVDLLDLRQLKNNDALLDEILRFGIKIYG